VGRTIPQNILDLGGKRETFRSEKRFAEADAVRKDIESQGFIIEDSPKGGVIRKA